MIGLFATLVRGPGPSQAGRDSFYVLVIVLCTLLSMVGIGFISYTLGAETTAQLAIDGFDRGEYYRRLASDEASRLLTVTEEALALVQATDSALWELVVAQVPGVGEGSFLVDAEVDR